MLCGVIKVTEEAYNQGRWQISYNLLNERVTEGVTSNSHDFSAQGLVFPSTALWSSNLANFFGLIKPSI